MRRFARRAMRQGLALGITDDLLGPLVEPVVAAYGGRLPRASESGRRTITDVLTREETLFRRTLSRGVREFAKVAGRHAERRRRLHALRHLRVPSRAQPGGGGGLRHAGRARIGGPGTTS